MTRKVSKAWPTMVDPMVRVHSHRPSGEDLEPGEGEGVGKLAHPVGDQAGGHEARYQAKDGFECLLVMPSGVGGKGHGHGAGGAEQRGGEEADPDGPPRRPVAIDLGEDVAKDIGNGEEQFGAADGQRPQAADLLGDQIRYQQDNDEDEHQRIEIFEACHPSAFSVERDERCECESSGVAVRGRACALLTRDFRVARVEPGRLRPARRLWAKQRPRRLARPRTPPFHGDNTGSNPVGDANKTNNLAKSTNSSPVRKGPIRISLSS